MSNYCKCGNEEKFALLYNLDLRNKLIKDQKHTCRDHFADLFKKPVLKTAAKRYSGFSKFQQEAGGFQQSGHS